MKRLPCASCPWRVDAHADAIPGFNLALAEELDRTLSDQLGAPMMACHGSHQDREVICVGWLWRYGWDNIGVRLKLMRGDLQPEDLEPDPSIELHETFEEFIAKLRDDEG
ncbi:MAG TPA: DUF6283 family protein [Solirubrobacteraceae bacterium]